LAEEKWGGLLSGGVWEIKGDYQGISRMLKEMASLVAWAVTGLHMESLGDPPARGPLFLVGIFVSR